MSEMRQGASHAGSSEAAVEAALGEAEQKFRESMKKLNAWKAQAEELVEGRPAIALASVAALGFLTGLVLRRSLSRHRDGFSKN